MNKINYTKQWTDYAKERLVGRTITDVSYLTSKECEDGFGWYKRPITFTLDDGKEVVAQMDDEGNDGGALWVGNEDGEEILPVLSLEDK